MAIFTSKREKRLWSWALIVLIGIYATLSLAQKLSGLLRESNLLDEAFWLALWLVGGTILGLALRARPSGAEIGVGLGITAVYLLLFLRMAIPEERSHLIEYSVLAAFIYEALKERQKNGGNITRPAMLAFVITVLLGWLDEAIQLFLPNRFYDLMSALMPSPLLWPSQALLPCHGQNNGTTNGKLSLHP